MLRALRRVPKSIIRAPDVPSIQSSLIAAARAPNYPSVLGNIFQNASYTINSRTGGGLLMNGTAIEVVTRLLRRGELINFGRQVGNTNVSRSAERTFRSTLSEVPENTIRSMDDSIAVNRVRHPDLNLRVDNNTTGSSLRDSMTPSARAKVDNALLKIRTIAAGAGTVAGIFVLFVIGTDLWDSLVQATRDRAGCFYAVVNTRTRQINSCRINGRTCIGDVTNTECTATVPSGIPYNMYYLLMEANTNTQLQNTIINLLSEITPGITWPQVAANDFQLVLDNSDNFNKLANLVQANTNLTVNPCAPYMNDDDVWCKACDPTNLLTSPDFVDLTDFPENETLVCVPPGSILETLVDIGFGIGEDLLGGVTNLISGFYSDNIWFFLIVLVTLIIIITLVSMFKK